MSRFPGKKIIGKRTTKGIAMHKKSSKKVQKVRKVQKKKKSRKKLLLASSCLNL